MLFPQGGDSGAPILHVETGYAIGIHTLGGCDPNFPDRSNSGTRIDQPDLVLAISELLNVDTFPPTGQPTQKPTRKPTRKPTIPTKRPTAKSNKNNQQGKSAKTAAKETLMNTATTDLLSMKMDNSGSSSGLFKLCH
jgi:hypothetical protein